MHVSDLIVKRLQELEAEMDSIAMIEREGLPLPPRDQWQQWATGVLSILQSVFGSGSAYHTNFKRIYEESGGLGFEEAKGVFRAAKHDFEGGYLFTVQSAVSGEVLGDFVALAKEALSAGHKDVAAVLASAALEDAIKRLAVSRNIDVAGKSMQDLVGALKAAGLVSGARKALLDTMPKIRDYAMHANWAKLTPPDVSSVIAFVEQFLISYFS